MTTTIERHPDDATMMSYAAGTLVEPLAAVMAAHVAMCPRCRRELRALEALGGLLLVEAPAGGVAAGPPTFHPDRLPAPEGPASLPPSRADEPGGLPAPIAHRYGLRLGAIRWRPLVPGVRHYPLALSPGAAGDLRLIRLEPGRTLPEHGHAGSELTLVLAGAFHDVTGRYRRGDIQDLDVETEHQLIVDPGAPCICLIASERPARYKSLVARLLQPWTGM